MQKNALLDALCLLITGPVLALTIFLDSKFPHLNPFLGFPRNAKEILDDPKAFFELVKSVRAYVTLLCLFRVDFFMLSITAFSLFSLGFIF